MKREGRKSFAGKKNNLGVIISPLAGIALLSVALSLSTTPIFLTITSSFFSGRKKRDLLSTLDPSIASRITPEIMKKIQELQVHMCHA